MISAPCVKPVPAESRRPVRQRTKTEVVEVHRHPDERDAAGLQELIAEEPLLIRVEDRPYSVVMRTPGDEIAHASGFCLGEGVVRDPDDLESVGYDEVAAPDVIDVWLRPERRNRILDRLERRFFISQSSCGICGKELIRDIHQLCRPAEVSFSMTPKDVFACVRQLSCNQRHYQTTRGSHAALVLDGALGVIAFAEDVGRHNALDKAIGKAFVARTLSRARVIVTSSRVSYELVQKAARARIPLMISLSRPTSMAVEIARGLNMTLVHPPADGELEVFCGAERVTPADAGGRV